MFPLVLGLRSRISLSKCLRLLLHERIELQWRCRRVITAGRRQQAEETQTR